MKPTRDEIDAVVAACRTGDAIRTYGRGGGSLVRPLRAIIVSLADKVAELERAAETSRAEHAAALAEAKRREDKAVELTVVTHAANVKLHADREKLRAEVAEHAAALGLATARIRELEGEREELLELLWEVPSHGVVSGDWFDERRAIVARIEKAAKGTR